MKRIETPTLPAVRAAIVGCERCQRLRSYCIEVGRVRKAAYRNQTYWAKPVPGFGDPRARMLILGLAPAAHGANRTGRVFTGDGSGGSGDFLMAALNRAGFANISTSERPDDGLVLTDAYIAAAVRCAPPANKPLPDEIDTCLDHLAAEVKALKELKVVVALGKIAWDAWLKLLVRERVEIPRPRPAFARGIRIHSEEFTRASARQALKTSLLSVDLVGCYHPSRQNTNTGKVTPKMYDAIFSRVVRRALTS